ncbi:MAG TPA: DUF2950 family protein [Planctomycetota bacterium]|jgi:hypothetical protein|nr:DUF2950 family protein [Planctomycetota bacterium]
MPGATGSRRHARGFTRIEGLFIASILLLLVAVSYPRWKGRALAGSEAAAAATLAAVADASARGEGSPAATLEALRLRRLEGAKRVADGVLEANGYLFRLASRPATDEAASAPAPGFVVLAWPVEYGGTGNAAFWLDEKGTCYETRNGRRRYGGLENPPAVTAAEEPSLPAPTSRRTRRFGRDGEEWQPLPLPAQK